MISRRILRIKALQTLYSFYQGGDMDIAKSEKELLFSIEKSYDLYYYLMQLAVEVCDYAKKLIETAMQKHLPTQEESNPNLRFANNKFVSQLRENKNFKEYITKKKMTWADTNLPKKIYTDLVATDKYEAYMNAESTSYAQDKDLISYMFENIIVECDDLYSTLEEQSSYWIDTVEFFVGMVLRTISRFKLGFDESYALMPMFKSPDDRQFVIKLFRTAVARCDQYRQLVSDNAQNWDLERIAFFDIITLQAALAEIEQFPEIPLRVTFNEYIELAKNYSTEKSPVFINGILDKIVQKLRADGTITKIAEMPQGM